MSQDFPITPQPKDSKRRARVISATVQSAGQIHASFTLLPVRLSGLLHSLVATIKWAWVITLGRDIHFLFFTSKIWVCTLACESLCMSRLIMAYRDHICSLCYSVDRESGPTLVTNITLLETWLAPSSCGPGEPPLIPVATALLWWGKSLVGRCMQVYTAREWISFLKLTAEYWWIIILVTALLICVQIPILIELLLLGHIDWMICYVSFPVCPLHPTSILTFMSLLTSLTNLQKQLADQFRPPSLGTLPLSIYTLGLENLSG